MVPRRFARAAFVAVLASLFPAVSLAQTSAIAGVVTDATGAILPGVTVEAASPALIEQTRTALTDGNGRYRIEDLRPATYKVTFTLPGFSTFVREGVAVEAEFTASINVQLRVGTLEETVTELLAPHTRGFSKAGSFGSASRRVSRLTLTFVDNGNAVCT